MHARYEGILKAKLSKGKYSYTLASWQAYIIKYGKENGALIAPEPEKVSLRMR